MAGPVVASTLAVPAIGFLVRFYVALSRDRVRCSAYRIEDLEQLTHREPDPREARPYTPRREVKRCKLQVDL